MVLMKTHRILLWHAKKCKLTFEDQVAFNEHIQRKHMNVQVNVNVQSTDVLFLCEKCDYKCKLSIALKKHIRKEHANEKEYKCSFCNFKADRAVDGYEHNLLNHPITTDLKQRSADNLKDFVLNLIAEQNLDLLDKLMDLKNVLRGAFEQLAGDFKDSIDLIFNQTILRDERINTELSDIEYSRRSDADKCTHTCTSSYTITTPVITTGYPIYNCKSIASIILSTSCFSEPKRINSTP